VAIEHGQEALGIGRIAALNNDIEDQAAFAGSQVELVAILDLTTTSDDDVSVRLEQADTLWTHSRGPESRVHRYVGEGEHLPAFRSGSRIGKNAAGRQRRSSAYP
jgi:hypothetical protein